MALLDAWDTAFGKKAVIFKETGDSGIRREYWVLEDNPGQRALNVVFLPAGTIPEWANE